MNEKLIIPTLRNDINTSCDLTPEDEIICLENRIKELQEEIRNNNNNKRKDKIISLLKKLLEEDSNLRIAVWDSKLFRTEMERKSSYMSQGDIEPVKKEGNWSELKISN